ncbi:MAG TPA: UvrD-helicase domain-containing protein, partial [Myxococcota bacterium]
MSAERTSTGHDDDAGARDAFARATAIDLTQPLALVAGAGAGKTTVLVDRLVAVLAEVPARAVAAVTFTEKAAAEIASRVRTQVARTAPHQLPELAQLTVTTLHGFARRLLLEEAFASGFPPGADVAVGGAAAADERAVRDEVIGAFVRQLRKDDRTLWRILDSLVTPGQLRRTIDTLLVDAADCAHDLDTPAPAAPDSSAIVETSTASLIDALARAKRAAGECSAVDDKLLLSWAAVQAGLEDAARAGEVELVVAAATHPHLAPKRNLGKKVAWPGDSKQRFLDVVDEIEAWQKSMRERVHGSLLRGLVREVVPQLRAERRARGLVAFDDLLLRARDLLADPAAQARLAQRFRVLLIDEVQDTDPLQADIARRLTRNLFVVGDPKQAIFRFRGGDVETFHRTAGLVEGRAALAKNFRAVPGLVAWVNHVFADLPGQVSQIAVRPAAALAPVIALAGCADDDSDDDSNASSKPSPAQAIAAHIGGLFANRAQVIDARTAEPRLAQPSDVMVVLPSWSAADEIADALAARGIPAVIDGGDRLFDRDEARLALATLRAIVDGSDSEAVLLCLRGVFGCTLTELWEHRAAELSFRPRAIAPTSPPTTTANVSAPPATRVERALDVLARAARRTGSFALGRLVDEVL